MIVNGNQINHSANNISDLLDHLNLKHENVVVEVNKVIVAKSEYNNHQLSHEDTIEIVSFVGGG